jgi:membrane fusion protein
MAQISAKNAVEEEELNRQVIDLKQHRLMLKAQSKYVIEAPVAGTVTAIVADVGQNTTGQPLLTLLPENSEMVAKLFVPSRSIGQVRKGDVVHIRYSGYPYQEFGQYGGVVDSVSMAPLSLQELPSIIALPMSRDPGEDVYQIDVKLKSQAVYHNGEKWPLTAGMPIDADIAEGRQPLISWLQTSIGRAN